MNIDLANCILTIFAAGFGAWGAYRFNIRQERKAQKEIEKAQLIQLFYDLHILSKYIYEYGINATKVANNIVNKHEYDVLQLSIYSKVIEIDKFGFITKKSNKMYEILVHTRMDAHAFIEQCTSYNFDIEKRKFTNTLYTLNNIEILFPKLLVKIYVSLFNINCFLMKYYNNKNLINDNILNNIVKIEKFIDKTKNDYIKIINSKDLINKYANEVYSSEYKKGYKVDLDYINYVLNEWILDFKLSKKGKKIIENNIK